MDLILSMLEKETAEASSRDAVTAAAMAEKRRDGSSWDESNKKQKMMDVDGKGQEGKTEDGRDGRDERRDTSDGNGRRRSSGATEGVGGSGGGDSCDSSNHSSGDAAIAGTSASANDRAAAKKDRNNPGVVAPPLPFVAAAPTGINLVSRAKERGDDDDGDQMDLDVQASASAPSPSPATKTATTATTITHPQTATEEQVKEIIASPAYREILLQQQRRQEEEREKKKKNSINNNKSESTLSASPSTTLNTNRAANSPASSNIATTVTPSSSSSSSTANPSSTILTDSHHKKYETSTAPSASTPATAPPSAMSTTTATSQTPTPTPIPAGRARTSEFINRLYHLCSTEGLEQPTFEFETVAFMPVSLFTATLTVEGLKIKSDGSDASGDQSGTQGERTGEQATANADVKTRGAFKSKKEAKEAAAEHGYWALTRSIAEGLLGREARGQACSEALAHKQQQKQQEGPKENWIGMLQEFCSKTGSPNPVFQEYVLGTRYGCETFISQRSKESSGDDPSGNVTTSNTDPSVNGIPFGGRNKLFPSKKAARHNAAAEAVAWLKENGYYSSATGKPVARPDEGKKADGGANGNEEDGGYVGMKKGMSYGQMVAEYCHLLALPQPEYRFENTPNAPPGFLTGAAYFLDHPEFDGPVGEVRNVYGKKAAKQECARAVAGVLSDMLAEERGLKG